MSVGLVSAFRRNCVSGGSRVPLQLMESVIRFASGDNALCCQWLIVGSIHRSPKPSIYGDEF